MVDKGRLWIGNELPTDIQGGNLSTTNRYTRGYSLTNVSAILIFCFMVTKHAVHCLRKFVVVTWICVFHCDDGTRLIPRYTYGSCWLSIGMGWFMKLDSWLECMIWRFVGSFFIYRGNLWHCIWGIRGPILPIHNIYRDCLVGFVRMLVYRLWWQGRQHRIRNWLWCLRF